MIQLIIIDNQDKLWKKTLFFSIINIVIKEEIYEKENLRRYTS